jgi:hypothetical protein
MASVPFAVHLFPDFGLEEPGKDLGPALAEGMVDVLARAGAKAIGRK